MGKKNCLIAANMVGLLKLVVVVVVEIGRYQR